MQSCVEAASRFTSCPVLVTGASGFIGGRVARALLTARARLTVLTRKRRDARRFAALGARVVRGALTPGAALDAAVAGQQVIFNLAYDVQAHGATNLAAFEALTESALRASVRRLVQASSIVVYDAWPGGHVIEASPRTCDDASYRGVKTRIERRLLELGADGRLVSATIEPTIVYGPRGRLWTDAPAERLLRGTVLLPDGAPGICHAVFVDDVAQAALLAGHQELEGSERYIISGPEPTTWRALYEGYASILGVGQVELRPAADLAARLTAAGAEGARVAHAGAPPLAARVGSILRRTLGSEANDRLRLAAVRLARLRGEAEVFPNAAELKLYAARGSCSSERARHRLGYKPRFDLSSGLVATREYLVRKYGRHA